MRKDHLDQHLRGPHKQTSVQRLRAKPAAASSIGNSTATSDITGVPLQSKKRKRETEKETSVSNLDKLEKELVEERRLRRLVEEDNHLQRQKLENYERRMEKYEERLDRMMALLEEHKREERR
jgi:phosphopentomutase